MLRLQHLSGMFSDDNARGHGVPGRHARDDRSVSATKVLDSVDLEATVHYRHCVSAHFGSTGLMPICDAGVPDEVFESGAFEIARHHLAFHEASECGGVTDLATDFHAGYHGLQVVWVRQRAGFDLDGIQRIGACETNQSSAFWAHDTCRHSPGSGRWVEPGYCLRTLEGRCTLSC